MGFFDFLNTPDINDGVARFDSTANAVLLDVRTPEEYVQGHIPHSRNIPLQELNRVETEVPDKAAPLFVYCLSGVRSRQAVSELKRMGYVNVENIGGINGYRGKAEK